LADREPTASVRFQRDLDLCLDLVRCGIDPHIGAAAALAAAGADPDATETKADLMRAAVTPIADHDLRNDLVRRGIDPGHAPATVVRHPDSVVADAHADGIVLDRDLRNDLE